MKIWRMRSACWVYDVYKATNGHSEFVILIFFSVAIMVARMRLNATLYVHCLA